MRVILLLLLLCLPAYSLTFDDGFKESWAEINGPQFTMVLSEKDVIALRQAFDKLEEEHLKNKYGIDNYIMGRVTRIIQKLESPDFLFLDEKGKGWRMQPMSTPEITLTGFAVSRNRYCRPEDQDIDDLQLLEAGVECYIRNTSAIALFEKIQKMQHSAPGGAKGG